MGEANEPSQGLTLAVIGAGKMGTAILSGILANRSTTGTTNSAPAPITKFIATVNTPASAQRLKTALAQYQNHDDDNNNNVLTVSLSSTNLSALKAADVVLLACKPYLAPQILTAPGVRAALSGKFLISVLAGSSPTKLENLIYGGENGTLVSWMRRPDAEEREKTEEVRCRIMRATPNMAASVGASETLLEAPSPATQKDPLPARFAALAAWIFGSVGGVRYVEPGVFDAASVVTGAGMAFLTVAVDGMLDGAVVEGLKRAEAREMLARTLKGLAALLGSGEEEEQRDGEKEEGVGGDEKGEGGMDVCVGVVRRKRRREGMHPAVLREEISSPRGTTIRGLLALEDGRVRMSFAKAVMDAAARAREL